MFVKKNPNERGRKLGFRVWIPIMEEDHMVFA